MSAADAPVRLPPERAEAGLWGLLIGDALGVPYEGHSPASLPPAESIDLLPPRGFARAHPGIPPGTWSDDGAQALALLDTLLASGGVDLDHFAGNLRAWLFEGRFAVNRAVFGMGRQTTSAINRLLAGVPPEQAGPASERDNGNGALMRVFPLLMRPWPSRLALAQAAIRQARVTHGHPRAHAACALYCLWVAGLCAPAPGDAWAQAEAFLRDPACSEALALPRSEIEQVLDPAWRDRAGGSGYVVDTLWSARIALEEGRDYAACVCRAIAFGHDTDTTAAVAGAAAGVRHGLQDVPASWREGLRGRGLVEGLLQRWRAPAGA